MNYIKKVLIKLLDKILAFSLQRPSSFPLKLADIQIKKKSLCAFEHIPSAGIQIEN